MTRKVDRPEWCGMCDPISRLVDRADGVAARCMRCHAACQPGGKHAPKPFAGNARMDLIAGDKGRAPSD